MDSIEEIMDAVEKTRGFAQEVSAEVKKVSWPSRQELQESTILVLLTVTILMVLTAVVDRVFSMLIELIVR
jgi:preprotein translocase subunit SecE